MDAAVSARADRRLTNPVFNDRKLKLGTFGTNLDRGCAISTIDGVHDDVGRVKRRCATFGGRRCVAR